jgi:dTDP-4-amino-4,6-dideoxygalactose transaminase
MEYKVRFVNYPEHYRRMWDEITGVISDTLSRGDLIMRSHLKDFEAGMASYLGVKYAIGLNSGTDALNLSLKALGVGPGDEVITVSHTFVATISAIRFCGATPVLLDVGDDMNMDAGLIEGAITPRTKAIIPVHLNGRMCDMEKVMEIAGDHGLSVVEDAAQALGATFDGKKAGSIGHAGCFSFYPAKILGCAGDGGMLATNDDAVARKMLLYRDHGLERETMEQKCYGYNSRLDNIQAAILNIKLKFLPSWIERRREIAALYQRLLAGIPGLRLPPAPASGGLYYDVYQNYVVRSKERDALMAYLRGSGIETLVSWSRPNHRHEALGLSQFMLPVTESLSGEVLSLPMFPELGDEEVMYVARAIYEFYGTSGKI